MATHVYQQGPYGLRTEFRGLLLFGRLSTKQFLLMFVFRRLKGLLDLKRFSNLFRCSIKTRHKQGLFLYTYLVEHMVNI